MGDEHLAVLAVFEWCIDLLANRGVDREAVVVGGDLDLSGGQILDRLVDATMAELQLVSAEAERTAQQLVTEADAEERVAGIEHLTQQFDFGAGLFRIARAIGEEDTVRVQGFEFGKGDGGGHHVHAASALGHTMRGHALDAKVHGGHGVQRFLAFVFAARLDGVSLLGGDFVVQAQALHLRGVLDILKQLLDGLELAGSGIDQSLAGEDAGAHHACGTQVAYQLTGVDMAQANDAVLDQVIVQAALSTPVTHVRGGITHDVAGHPDARGFGILAVHAGIADVREGLHDDLAIVARIGERLLVSGHAGGEDDLTGRPAQGAIRLPHIYLSVFQNEDCIVLVIHRNCDGSGLVLAHQNPLMFFGYSYQG